MTITDTTQLIHLLLETTNAASSKTATNQLSLLSSNSSFAVDLLSLTNSNINLVPLIAAIHLKNHIKLVWQTDANIDRIQIKLQIIHLLVTVNVPIQKQLSEIIANVAESDFPDAWPDLISCLVSHLSPSNYQVNLAILSTAHSIFKRWKGQYRSNKLFSEINLVLGQFCIPYLALFKATDALVVSNSTNAEALSTLLPCILLCFKIYNDLISQDLPEFVEDNHPEFMMLLDRYLSLGPSSSTSEEPGHYEMIQTVICEILETYSQRYEEEFHKLPIFVQSVWVLLIKTTLDPKYDLLVSKAIGFLSSVAKQPRHNALFSNPDTLSQICEKIVLPNMMLRESDQEDFEDDPMEYIRRDLEGSGFNC